MYGYPREKLHDNHFWELKSSAILVGNNVVINHKFYSMMPKRGGVCILQAKRATANKKTNKTKINDNVPS